MLGEQQIMHRSFFPFVVLVTWLIAGIFVFPNARAADFPKLEIPLGFGIQPCVDPATQKTIKAKMDAGIHVVRCELRWEVIERVSREYDWSGTSQLLDMLRQNGLTPLFLLDYSNRIYEPNQGAPRRKESIDAFARWASSAVSRFSERGVIWEIWNEPNLDRFWKPKANAKEFARLALAACHAMRKTGPKETIIGPASFGFPWSFLETFFQSGILKCLDGVSVHPYRLSPPGTALEEFATLRGLIDKYAPSDRPQIPIVVTEWGYHTTAKTGVSPQAQASNFISLQLISLLHGIPIVVWHRWEDLLDPTNSEANFGLVKANGKAKLSLLAAKKMMAKLAGYSVICRLAEGTSNDFFLLLSNNKGGRKVAAWTMRETHRVTLTLPAAGNKPVLDVWPPVCGPEKGTNTRSFWLSHKPKLLTIDSR